MAILILKQVVRR